MVLGQILFVISLKKRHYKYQFKRFALCHVVLLLVVTQSTFIVVNMFEGLLWFLLPAALVIANDIWAYIFGFFLGKTPLIRLSPKKTWQTWAVTDLRHLWFSRFCKPEARKTRWLKKLL